MGFIEDKKFFLLAIASSLVLPETALADVLSVWTEETIKLSPIIYFSEVVYFWFYTERLLHRYIGIGKILLIVCIANVVTAALGSFYSGRFGLYPVRAVGIALLFSVLIEWVIYISFLRKHNIGAFTLLRISFIGNLISHSIIALFFLYLN